MLPTSLRDLNTNLRSVYYLNRFNVITTTTTVNLPTTDVNSSLYNKNVNVFYKRAKVFNYSKLGNKTIIYVEFRKSLYFCHYLSQIEKVNYQKSNHTIL